MLTFYLILVKVTFYLIILSRRFGFGKKCAKSKKAGCDLCQSPCEQSWENKDLN